MNVWPLKDDSRKVVPRTGSGSFWEDRRDRRHCGVDLYAPRGTPVLAMDEGEVVRIGIMTSPRKIPYWNTTRYVVVRHGSIFVKYGELGRVNVRRGGKVSSGQKIGEVGLVLVRDRIRPDSPLYIRRLGGCNPSMLHLEFYREAPAFHSAHYLGGNWFGEGGPAGLLDPTPFLAELKRNR